MHRLQKILVLVLCLCFSLAILTSCQVPQQAEKETLNLYASFYPIYALTAMITEGIPDVYLKVLAQPQDGCLRSYSLSDWDLALLSRSADAVILGGEGLESFETLLYLLGEEGPAVSTVLNGIELTQQEGINTQQDAETHWLDPNPHIYMKIDGALEILRHIAASMEVMDPRYASEYGKNLEEAEGKLEAVKSEIHDIVGDTSGIKVAVMNETLVYVAQEFELNAVLYYDRDSGENLSGTDLDRCLQSLEESGAQVVLIEKQAPQSLMEALKAEDYSIAAMDTMSTRSANQGYSGLFETYSFNADALATAISETDFDMEQETSGGYQ